MSATPRLNPHVVPDGTNATSRVVAAMGHDLRTPLNSIIGFAGTLLMQLPGPLNADQEKHLRTVQASGRHLLHLINTIVDLAKIESGALAVQEESVDCAVIAEQALAAVRPRAETRGLALSLENRLARGRMLRGDPGVLARILSSFAENAVQYTERGGVRIVLAEERDPESGQPAIEFQVHDTGPGIPASEQSGIFDGPGRAAGPVRRPGQGAGLGLYLSARLAKLAGCRVRLDSEPGRGSVFTLVVPEAAA